MSDLHHSHIGWELKELKYDREPKEGHVPEVVWKPELGSFVRGQETKARHGQAETLKGRELPVLSGETGWLKAFSRNYLTEMEKGGPKR